MSEYRTDTSICTQKIHLFESGKCPSCETDLTDESHKTMLHDFLEKNDLTKKLMADIKIKQDELTEKKTKIRSMYSDVNTKKVAADTQLSSLRNELAKLNTGNINDAQTQSLENLITDTNAKKQTALVKKSEEEKKGNFFKIVEEIFGDKGVKLSALKRIVPLLNAEIRKVMVDLNMDYRVTFNEEFDVDIQHLGFKISPDQLSTGERKKIDFATLIALIRLMKIRFAGLNLTFLDEIFSSIDSDGIYHILKVLHKTCRELNLNIFVINHSQLPTEIFDYKLEIEKNNGFSHLLVEKIG
jgi:DNA repair exonuclease SbcCD ATPase subunit